MAREIKFRQALLKEDNCFIKFHYWGILGDGGLTGKASGYKTGADQQYTGLKDKNGVEIYEGDLLRWGSGSVTTISFQQGSFGYDGNMGFVQLYQKQTEDEIVWGEVIGNIYENKELLC